MIACDQGLFTVRFSNLWLAKKIKNVKLLLILLIVTKYKSFCIWFFFTIEEIEVGLLNK